LEVGISVARGRQSVLAELRSNVGCGEGVSTRRSGAAFKQVARQEFDVSLQRVGAHEMPRRVALGGVDERRKQDREQPDARQRHEGSGTTLHGLDTTKYARRGPSFRSRSVLGSYGLLRHPL